MPHVKFVQLVTAEVNKMRTEEIERHEFEKMIASLHRRNAWKSELDFMYEDEEYDPDEED